jgi:hypothetical protein
MASAINHLGFAIPTENKVIFMCIAKDTIIVQFTQKPPHGKKELQPLTSKRCLRQGCFYPTIMQAVTELANP